MNDQIKPRQVKPRVRLVRGAHDAVLWEAARYPWRALGSTPINAAKNLNSVIAVHAK